MRTGATATPHAAHQPAACSAAPLRALGMDVELTGAVRVVKQHGEKALDVMDLVRRRAVRGVGV